MKDKPPRCEVTGKMIFDTMQRAKRRAKMMRQKHESAGRAYRCRHCHQIHIGEMDASVASASRALIAARGHLPGRVKYPIRPGFFESEE